MDLTTMTDAELEARSAELYEQRQALSAEMGAISAELGNREREKLLAREAERFTDEELARMAALRQEIRPVGVESAEAFGIPGAR